jgi:hypothetical protein
MPHTTPCEDGKPVGLIFPAWVEEEKEGKPLDVKMSVGGKETRLSRQFWQDLRVAQHCTTTAQEQ